MIELGTITARTEGDSCPGQQHKPIRSWSNSGRTAWSDALTTTDRSSSNCINSPAAIMICTPSARSVASARNFAAAMIRSGTFFAVGQRTKSIDWIAQRENRARRLVRYAVRPCKGIPCPVYRSFVVFVAGTPISGSTFTCRIDFAWMTDPPAFFSVTATGASGSCWTERVVYAASTQARRRGTEAD